MQNLVDKWRGLQTWVKVFLGLVVALPVGLLLGIGSVFLAVLVILGALATIIYRALRRRPLKGPAAVLLASFVAFVVFVVAIPTGGSTGAGSSPRTSAPAPAPAPASKASTKRELVPVKIRVSGAPGTGYACKNSSFAFEADEAQPVRSTEDVRGTLGNEPILYDSQAIDKYPWAYDFVAASCRITTGSMAMGGAPEGSLKAEILVDGQVKASEETRPDPPGKRSMESEHVQPRWAPQCPNWDVDWDCG